MPSINATKIINDIANGQQPDASTFSRLIGRQVSNEIQELSGENASK